MHRYLACEGGELSVPTRRALEDEVLQKCMGGTGRKWQPEIESIIVVFKVKRRKKAWGLSGSVRIMPDSPLTGC